MESRTTTTMTYATESRIKTLHNTSLKDKIKEGIKAKEANTAQKKKRGEIILSRHSVKRSLSQACGGINFFLIEFSTDIGERLTK